ncbi:MAG: penicillin acylase family protein [Lysobacteraceae bacterium]|nr:MAG: penicillin acylase family protein [Xanthomonadaceae bacterium]
MRKWFKRIALLLLALLVIGAGAGWWLMRGSLANLDGEIALAGLSAPVSIQRDANGTVTIDAANEGDAMRALGYVHAQERYFEMDLLRRSAAGELAELFGEIALDHDKRQRAHRMRARAHERLDAITDGKRESLQAYVDGVNAGLAGLRVRPWPYLLLRQSPKRWEATDSALTGYAMYFDLQDARNEHELAMWKLRPHVPAALFALIAHGGSRWDAPLRGEAIGDAPLPAPEVLDLRKLPMPSGQGHGGVAVDILPGSNNFAVAGGLTADGRAIVANDMHLSLRAPNIWFRARLRYADPNARDRKVDVTGFTLPGLPGMVVGSNGHVAWGFTNSYIDTTDWLIAPACAKNAAANPTNECARISVHRESIRVAGGDPIEIEIEQTEWGPVMDRDDQGRVYALRWNAHLDGSLGFGLTELAAARDLDHALAIADRVAIPTQNLLVGDGKGRIAWRLLGPLAQRDPACIPSLPSVSAADVPSASCPVWRLATDRAPTLVDPPSQRLWTANNRTLSGDELAQVGDGGYAIGARAKQIRDGLFAKQRFSERDLLAIQLDDRALFLTPWHRLLMDSAASTKQPALTELAATASRWEERASPDSVSYRIVRAWRLVVLDRIAEGLTAPAQAALGEKFEMPAMNHLEGIAWPMVLQRPAHLLPRRFTCAAAGLKDGCDDSDRWNAVLEDAAVEIRDELKAKGHLAERNWGERNTAAICHPLSGAIPYLGARLLCMPPDRLPGDGSMPRVQSPDFGASERMVVSPGHEADGITHMPGGQSGHPLSPFWGAGHDDWVHGRPTPFLPGKTAYTLNLKPSP